MIGNQNCSAPSVKIVCVRTIHKKKLFVNPVIVLMLCDMGIVVDGGGGGRARKSIVYVLTVYF